MCVCVRVFIIELLVTKYTTTRIPTSVKPQRCDEAIVNYDVIDKYDAIHKYGLRNIKYRRLRVIHYKNTGFEFQYTIYQIIDWCT